MSEHSDGAKLVHVPSEGGAPSNWLGGWRRANRYARIGGALYLLIIVAGIAGPMLTRDPLIIPNDADATAHNIAVAPEVVAWASARGIADRVTPVEYRADMPNVFASCDLVVDASWAGTGITGTIREAMALEKPVIATNAGGNDELLTSPEVGWLIPMRDHDALVAAIREVIEKPERAAAVARRARPHVINGYSKELRITRLQDLYRRILRSKGRAPESAR